MPVETAVRRTVEPRACIDVLDRAGAVCKPVGWETRFDTREFAIGSLFPVVGVEQVFRQAEVSRWRGLAIRGAGRRDREGLRFAALRDRDFLAVPDSCRGFRKVRAGFRDPV